MKKIFPVFSAAFIFMQSFSLQAGHFIELGTLNKKSAVQNDGIQGKFMINAGIGGNFLGTALSFKYQLSSFWDDRAEDARFSKSVSPFYHLSVDYGLSRQFSVGVGFGYQTARVEISDYGGTTYQTTFNSADYPFVDSWQRIYMGVKGDYHILAKDNFSLYTGLRLGYNVYSIKSTVSPHYPTYTQELNVDPSPVSLQVHIGASYYFNSIVGFNAEVGLGIGVPYVATVGLAVKI